MTGRPRSPPSRSCARSSCCWTSCCRTPTGSRSPSGSRENGAGPVVVLTSSRQAADFGSRLERSPARGFIHKDDLSGAALARLAVELAMSRRLLIALAVAGGGGDGRGRARWCCSRTTSSRTAAAEKVVAGGDRRDLDRRRPDRLAAASRQPGRAADDGRRVRPASCRSSTGTRRSRSPSCRARLTVSRSRSSCICSSRSRAAASRRGSSGSSSHSPTRPWSCGRSSRSCSADPQHRLPGLPAQPAAGALGRRRVGVWSASPATCC